MIQKTERLSPLLLRLCAGDGVTALRLRTAIRAQTAACYTVNGGAGLLGIEGQAALYCGAVADEQELTEFLQLLGVRSFTSESMTLSAWRPQPQLCMRFAHLHPLPPAAATHTIDTEPNLWQLAGSGLLDADADAWYANACARVNKGLAAIYAIARDGRYVATAGAYCIDDTAAYLTAIATEQAARREGCARALITALCNALAPRCIYLLCAPPMRGFYEKLGFQLAIPVCTFLTP